VSPLYFFPEKPSDLFLVASSAVSPDFFFAKTDDLFLLMALSLFIAFTRVLRGCHPTPFYLSDLISPLFFVNLPTKKFFPSSVTPLEGVTRGGPPP